MKKPTKLSIAGLVAAGLISGISHFTIPKTPTKHLLSYPKFHLYNLKDLLENSLSYDFSEDSDKILLAKMIFGEARGCSEIEKIAVAYTAINRLNNGKGKNLKEILLAPHQYSCFNENDVNRYKLKYPYLYELSEWKSCLEISEKVLTKKLRDPTDGATHYYNPKKVKTPYWAKKLYPARTPSKSQHIFFKEKIKHT